MDTTGAELKAVINASLSTLIDLRVRVTLWYELSNPNVLRVSIVGEED